MNIDNDVIALMEAYETEIIMQDKLLKENFDDVRRKIDELISEFQKMLHHFDTEKAGSSHIKNKIRSILLQLEPIRNSLY
jgi:hypothetical protein